jgi:hypothetical protein
MKYILMLLLFNLLNAHVENKKYENKFIETFAGNKKLYIRETNKLTINLFNGKRKTYKDKVDAEEFYLIYDYYHFNGADYLILVKVFGEEQDYYMYLCVNLYNGDEMLIELDNVVFSPNNHLFISYSHGVEFNDGGYIYLYAFVPKGLPKVEYKKIYKYPFEPRNIRWIDNEKIEFEIFNDLNQQSVRDKIFFNKQQKKWSDHKNK